MSDARKMVFSPGEVATLGLSKLELQHHHKDRVIPFPLESLQYPKGVFYPLGTDELCSVLGRPGSGKSGLMIAWARWLANWFESQGRNDEAVVYITYEQHIEDLWSFIAAAESGVSVTDLAMGQVPEHKWAPIKTAAIQFGSKPLWMVGHSVSRPGRRPPITVEVLVEACHVIQESMNIKIGAVFVDYLQRIPLPKYTESKVVGTSDNLDRLKDGALEVVCPFIVGCQATRVVDTFDPPVPRLDSGEWTANIDKASDRILAPMRPVNYYREGDNVLGVEVRGHSQMLLTVVKQKKGAMNVPYWVHFAPEFNRLSSASIHNIPMMGDATYDAK